MKEQLIKEITDEVVKYVPEIMELKFGCRVEFGFSSVVYCGVDSNFDYIEVLEPAQPIKTIQKVGKGILQKKKILGRDITLEDILIVARKVINNKPEAFFVPHHIIVSDVVIKSRWQLGKPLHEQSVETLQFIRDILK